MSTIVVSTAGGERTLAIDDLVSAEIAERAETEANAWIKQLRHARVDGATLRDRFTLRGDSLWWFAELYLHKRRIVTRALRSLARAPAVGGRAAARLARRRDRSGRWPCRARRRGPARLPLFRTARGATAFEPAGDRGESGFSHGHARWPIACGPDRAARSRSSHRGGVRSQRVCPAGRRMTRPTWARCCASCAGDSARTRLHLVGLGPRTNFRVRRWRDRRPRVHRPRRARPAAHARRFVRALAGSGAVACAMARARRRRAARCARAPIFVRRRSWTAAICGNCWRRSSTASPNCNFHGRPARWTKPAPRSIACSREASSPTPKPAAGAARSCSRPGAARFPWRRCSTASSTVTGSTTDTRPTR